MEGKVIKIVRVFSVFSDYLGRYGIVIKKAYGDKWLVEFNAKTIKTGELRHTVSEKDFEVVGEVRRD